MNKQTTFVNLNKIDINDARGHVSSLLGEANGDKHSNPFFAAARIETLIAEIEALRARVAELEPLVRDGVRRAENCMEWQSRAEAAEARVVELELQLKDFLDE